MTYKVIMLVDSRAIGGIETHILNVALLLKQNGINTTVMFLKNYNNEVFNNRLAQAGIQFDFLNGISKLIKLIMHQPKDTVIHTHGYKAGILARFISVIFGKRVVSTFHAGETHTGLLGLYCFIDNLSSILSKNFAVSREISEKVYDAQNFKNFILQSSNIPTSKDKKSELNVGFVGRLSAEKGPEQFLALAESFKLSGDLHFHVFGDGNLKTLFTGSTVTLNGICEPAVIWSTLDVLVISSYYEGLPMTVLEAMANGVFVIAPHVGALSDVVQHNHTGLVSQSNKAQDLAIALEQRLSLSNDEVNAIVKQAKKFCHEHYSGSQQWLQLDKQYRLLLGV